MRSAFDRARLDAGEKELMEALFDLGKFAVTHPPMAEVLALMHHLDNPRPWTAFLLDKAQACNPPEQRNRDFFRLAVHDV